MNNKIRKNGFTLIEIMIVMSIVAMLMSLVGPIAIQNLEKTEAKSELLSIKNWLKKVSFQAYMGGQPLVVSFAGKEITLHTEIDNKIIANNHFKYLFFQPQTIYINNKGFVFPNKVLTTYRNKTLELDLSQSINQELVDSND